MKTLIIILTLCLNARGQVLIGSSVKQIKRHYQKYTIEEQLNYPDVKLGISTSDGLIVYWFMSNQLIAYYAALYPKSQVIADSIKVVYDKNYVKIKDDQWLSKKDTLDITFENVRQPHFNYMKDSKAYFDFKR
jgi:hypothetical protein